MEVIKTPGGCDKLIYDSNSFIVKKKRTVQYDGRVLKQKARDAREVLRPMTRSVTLGQCTCMRVHFF